ncbi:hypothetical protein [Pseudoalteromonas phenolica]|uniref:hypothetical protein n=1 Tax=Pseudoalteromonas phenolica TaxID=161398 RepID=UPI00110B47E5|nr:hypothetical protein [Pseudoalteromonas phenolica]TMO58183.1 hypothetical protein CWC21_00415 [Pseudoalteromonas phenolica]
MRLFLLCLIIVVPSFTYSGSTQAGTCEIKYTRTSCPGKEKISYKKCKGKQKCSKFKEAATAAECGTMAVKSCRNKRLTVTKSKVINALFDGQQIKASNGNDNFCTVYEKANEEFNKCDG